MPDCIFRSVAGDQRVGSDLSGTGSCCSVGGVMPKSWPSAGPDGCSYKVGVACCCWPSVLVPLNKMDNWRALSLFGTSSCLAGHLPS